MLFIVGLCILAACGRVLGECSGGCDQPTLLYDDLKCQPKYLSPDACCPVTYDCSHIVARAASVEEKCHFHGKTYNTGDAINDDEIYANCQVGCTCRKKDSGNLGFTCAVLDCPEWLGLPPNPGCYFKYNIDKCCNVGQACPPFTGKCEVGGKTYTEGQKFNAPNLKCTKCVCQEGFSGKLEEPFCKKRSCNEEVRRQPEIKNFCAPTYIHLDDCCPFNWVCPENDTIVPSTNPPSTHADLKCKFGESLLNIGDKFERTSDNGGKVNCECRIPPYLTCIQNYEYPSYAPEY